MNRFVITSIDIANKEVRVSSGIFSVYMLLYEDDKNRIRIHHPSRTFIPDAKMYRAMVAYVINAYKRAKLNDNTV